MEFTAYYCGMKQCRYYTCTVWRLYPVDLDSCSTGELQHMPYELRRYSAGECYLYDSHGEMITRVTIHRKGRNCPHIFGDLPTDWGFANIVRY